MGNNLAISDKTEVVLAAFDSGKTIKQISDSTKTKYDSVRGMLRRAGRINAVSEDKRRIIADRFDRGISARITADEMGIEPTLVEWVYAQLSRQAKNDNEQKMEAGQHSLHAEKLALGRMVRGPARGLLLFDPHFNRVYLPAFRAALKAAGKFDFAVWGGDILDQYIFSRFGHADDRRLKEEMEMAAECKAQVRRKVDGPQFMIMGNHDARPMKQIEMRLQAAKDGLDKPDAARITRGLNESWKAMYADGVTRVHMDWWIPFGNPDRPNIVAHPDRYTKAELTTPKNVRDYFTNRQIVPQSIAIGHLHRCVPYTYNGQCWLSEMPALCQRQGYMNASKAYGGALHVGYGILVLDKQGNFVPNESQAYFVAAI